MRYHLQNTHAESQEYKFWNKKFRFCCWTRILNRFHLLHRNWCILWLFDGDSLNVYGFIWMQCTPTQAFWWSCSPIFTLLQLCIFDYIWEFNSNVTALLQCYNVTMLQCYSSAYSITFGNSNPMLLHSLFFMQSFVLSNLLHPFYIWGMGSLYHTHFYVISAKSNLMVFG